MAPEWDREVSGKRMRNLFSPPNFPEWGPTAHFSKARYISVCSMWFWREHNEKHQKNTWPARKQVGGVWSLEDFDSKTVRRVGRRRGPTAPTQWLTACSRVNTSCDPRRIFRYAELQSEEVQSVISLFQQLECTIPALSKPSAHHKNLGHFCLFKHIVSIMLKQIGEVVWETSLTDALTDALCKIWWLYWCDSGR